MRQVADHSRISRFRSVDAPSSQRVSEGNTEKPSTKEAAADQTAAAQRIIDSKSFDNSVLCTNESVLLTLDSNRQRFERALRAAGGYLCNEADVARLRDFLFPGGHLNTAAVGKSAVWIARQVGIRVVPGTKVLIAPVDRAGIEEPLTREKLCPVLALMSVGTFERAKGVAQMILRMSGAGHSAAYHGEDAQQALDYAAALCVYRVVVNAPCSQGAAGFATHLAPSFMIGTGYAGRSSVGENIGPQHLVHWTRLAWNSDAAVPFGDFSHVRAPFEGPDGSSRPTTPSPTAAAPTVPSPTIAPSPTTAPSQGFESGADRELLRHLILQELRQLTGGQP
ncbi:hypothetical protein QO002_002438 [Pararhizobium capsulatum DSM 1112]|uniref:Uncharacterized protein n=1 Tax=Pararhizobium capsulatum DSM 1112 TaxID=1121113 RepID=A0ABU0BS30_9HYPH|nr:hypothetical protein [Pararhizobium capsulatum]MDQ0320300.1 hypothetical protein [Pararhizobium capsulatum DSM 1112]